MTEDEQELADIEELVGKLGKKAPSLDPLLDPLLGAACAEQMAAIIRTEIEEEFLEIQRAYEIWGPEGYLGTTTCCSINSTSQGCHYPDDDPEMIVTIPADTDKESFEKLMCKL